MDAIYITIFSFRNNAKFLDDDALKYVFTLTVCARFLTGVFNLSRSGATIHASFTSITQRRPRSFTFISRGHMFAL